MGHGNIEAKLNYLQWLLVECTSTGDTQRISSEISEKDKIVRCHSATSILNQRQLYVFTANSSKSWCQTIQVEPDRRCAGDD